MIKSTNMADERIRTDKGRFNVKVTLTIWSNKSGHELLSYNILCKHEFSIRTLAIRKWCSSNSPKNCSVIFPTFLQCSNFSFLGLLIGNETNVKVPESSSGNLLSHKDILILRNKNKNWTKTESSVLINMNKYFLRNSKKDTLQKIEEWAALLKEKESFYVQLWNFKSEIYYSIKGLRIVRMG